MAFPFRQFIKLVLWAGLAVLAWTNVGCQRIKMQQLAEQKMREKCKQSEEWFLRINRNPDEFGPLPKTMKLTDKPYINGKILFLQRHYFNKAETPRFHHDGIFLSDDCKQIEDAVTGKKYGNEDELYEVRARSGDEVQTIVYLDCASFAQDYVKEGETDPYAMKTTGFEESCTMSLVDRSISAVIFKKDFHSDYLQQVEKVQPGAGAFSKDVSIMEIDKYLLTLPRH